MNKALADRLQHANMLQLSLWDPDDWTRWNRLPLLCLFPLLPTPPSSPRRESLKCDIHELWWWMKNEPQNPLASVSHGEAEHGRDGAVGWNQLTLFTLHRGVTFSFIMSSVQPNMKSLIRVLMKIKRGARQLKPTVTFSFNSLTLFDKLYIK